MALAELDQAIQEGVDPGPLLDQLLGYFRDMMAIAVGCQPELLLYCDNSESEQLTALAQQLGLEGILAGIQVLAQTAVRMRQSTHGRILLEMAVVRIAKLEDLEGLSQIIAELRTDSSQAISKNSVALKKKIHEPAVAGKIQQTSNSTNGSSTSSVVQDQLHSSSPGQTASPAKTTSTPDADKTVLASKHSSLNLNPDNVLQIWKSAISRLDGLIVDQALKAESIDLASANSAPNCLVIGFPERYNSCRTFCESAERRSQLERALQEETGVSVRLQFNTIEGTKASQKTTVPVVSRRQQMREIASHPTVSRAIELFDAELVRVDQPRGG